MSPLTVYTEYRCRDCGATTTIKTDVGHTQDYGVAQEYALVTNEYSQELATFEDLHSAHIYTYDLKLEPIGDTE